MNQKLETFEVMFTQPKPFDGQIFKFFNVIGEDNVYICRLDGPNNVIIVKGAQIGCGPLFVKKELTLRVVDKGEMLRVISKVTVFDDWTASLVETVRHILKVHY